MVEDNKVFLRRVRPVVRLYFKLVQSMIHRNAELCNPGSLIVAKSVDDFVCVFGK